MIIFNIIQVDGLLLLIIIQEGRKIKKKNLNFVRKSYDEIKETIDEKIKVDEEIKIERYI